MCGGCLAVVDGQPLASLAPDIPKAVCAAALCALTSLHGIDGFVHGDVRGILCMIAPAVHG